MSALTVTQSQVLQQSRFLPGWPVVLNDILATLDNPDANMQVLIRAIQRDPVVTGRVLWVANTAGAQGHWDHEPITDITTAVQMAGLAKVRHVTLISSLSTLASGARVGVGGRFWKHSLAVGVGCEELAQHTGRSDLASSALVAGLLHDVGQLWLGHLDPEAMRQCHRQAQAERCSVEDLEREAFGATHSQVGRWLADMWKLPDDVCTAIACHHTGLDPMGGVLTSLVHLSEVLSHALALEPEGNSAPVRVSTLACERIGLDADDDLRPLFGRMEARARHAFHFFNAGPLH